MIQIYRLIFNLLLTGKGSLLLNGSLPLWKRGMETAWKRTGTSRACWKHFVVSCQCFL